MYVMSHNFRKFLDALSREFSQEAERLSMVNNPCLGRLEKDPIRAEAALLVKQIYARSAQDFEVLYGNKDMIEDADEFFKEIFSDNLIQMIKERNIPKGVKGQTVLESLSRLEMCFNRIRGNY